MGIVKNNRLDNLEYANHREQAYHRDNIGPSKGKSSLRVLGSNNPMSKLSVGYCFCLSTTNPRLYPTDLSPISIMYPMRGLDL